MSARPEEPFEVLDAETALARERAHLGLSAQAAGSALCLSGGGIRSAAFSLGVVQALLADKLLAQFNYLSTVSGGGYIGAWLRRLIAAYEGDVAAALGEIDYYELEDGRLKVNTASTPNEPWELRLLRCYTNFLNPSASFASTDAFAIYVLWARNTLINWAVFAPMFFAVGAGANAYMLLEAALLLTKDWPGGWYDAAYWLGVAGLAAAFFATFFVCRALPSHAPLRDPPGTGGVYPDVDPSRGWQTGSIWVWILLPTMLWVFVAPLSISAMLAQGAQQGTPQAQNLNSLQKLLIHEPAPAAVQPDDHQNVCCKCGCVIVPSKAPEPAAPLPQLDWRVWLWLPVSNFIVSLLAFGLAAIGLPVLRPQDKAGGADLNCKAFRANALAWGASAALASGLQAAGCVLAARLTMPGLLAVCGPLWFLAAESVRTASYVAARRYGTFADLDREWLARLSGARLRAGLSGAGLVAVCALLPPIMFKGEGLHFSPAFYTLVAGPVLAWFGRSGWTPALLGGAKAGTPAVSLNLILAAASALFGLFVLAVAGRFVQAAVLWLVTAMAAAPAVAAVAMAVLTWLAVAGVLRAALTVGLLDLQGFAAGLWLPELLAVLLVGGGGGAMLWVYDAWPGFFVHAGASMMPPLVGFLAAGLALMLCSGAWALAQGIDLAVNLNRFSMHAVYRNRLIRAFLGSARRQDPVVGHEPPRAADPFTRFAPRDNMRLADVASARAVKRGRKKLGRAARAARNAEWVNRQGRVMSCEAARRLRVARKQLSRTLALFPVINATLNRTSGPDTARAQRKGEAFIFTPLHCGAAELGEWQGRFVPTDRYAGGGQEKDMGPNDPGNGISLGTAMALSGAYITPNQGYNSSPFTAFLMTLFNFRLGAWLPNPGAPDLDKDVAMQSGPTYNIPTLLNELAGKASDSAPYVYLSDGGHFENLGLYEMLRRRCQHILAVDAGDDEKYTYESLAGALRAAFIDFGVTVKFTPEIVSGKPPANGIYFGKISYPAYVVGGKRFAPPAGQLIYLRTFLPDDPPVEISGYMQTHDHFPHETGTNQFFTESDFEAYRHLGACIAGRLISNARAAAKISAGERLTISNFFAAALTFCTKPPVQDIT